MRFRNLGATWRDVAQISVGVDPRGLPPPVAVERRLAGVARLTQTAEVGLVMGAAVLQRDDVVDFLRRGVPASREAVLAQGVGFAEAGVGEVRAAGLGTRTGRLDRHHAPLSRTRQSPKAPSR